MLLLFSLLVLTSSTAYLARGEVFSSCDPLPEPNAVNQFLRTNRSDLRNPAFRKTVNGLTATGGFRLPRQLQVVKCRSLRDLQGDSSYEFYQVESPSKGCNAPPPLDFDIAPRFRGAFERPGGPLLFFSVLVSAIVTGLTGLVISLSILELVVLRSVRGLWRMLCNCASPRAKASEQETSVVKVSVERGAFVQANGVMWTLDKSAQPADHADPLSEGHLAVGETDSGLPFRRSNARTDRAAPHAERTSASKRSCGCLVFLAELVYSILLFASFGGPVGFVLLLMMCQVSVNDITLKGPIGLPDPARGLNGFLSDSGTGLNLTLCSTKTMNFYVSCPGRNCTDLGDPYGDLAPAEPPLKVCPDYFGRVKRTVVEQVCYGVAGTVALLITVLCGSRCVRSRKAVVPVTANSHV